MKSSFDVPELRRATILDSSGNRVGKVSDIYADDSTGELSFVTVRTGWFGMRETLIPLHEARLIRGDLHVPFPKDVIKDAPQLDRDEHITATQEFELFEYYDIEDELLIERSTSKPSAHGRLVKFTEISSNGGSVDLRSEEVLIEAKPRKGTRSAESRRPASGSAAPSSGSGPSISSGGSRGSSERGRSGRASDR